ncbi:MAG: ATP cone domain-containing protein, partial [Pseudomonadota bacterium]
MLNAALNDVLPAQDASNLAGGLHITHILKRDESLKPFKAEKITEAIFKAMQAQASGTKADAEAITAQVVQSLVAMKLTDSRYVPSIEAIQ